MSMSALATWVRALWASLEHCWLAGELAERVDADLVGSRVRQLAGARGEEGAQVVGEVFGDAQ